MTSAQDALARLVKGNQRFTAGISHRTVDSEQRMQLVSGQAPFAIIVGCSDSRVPVELVFDANLGDLFVIRVAGNVVDATVAGSAEFAAANFGSKIVVVLGHTACGAVAATLGEMQNPTADLSPNLRSIVDSIKPSLQHLKTTEVNDSISLGVKANVLQSVKRLASQSKLLKQMVDEGELMIIGAQYDLKSGEVEFFDQKSS